MKRVWDPCVQMGSEPMVRWIIRLVAFHAWPFHATGEANVRPRCGRERDSAPTVRRRCDRALHSCAVCPARQPISMTFSYFNERLRNLVMMVSVSGHGTCHSKDVNREKNKRAVWKQSAVWNIYIGYCIFQIHLLYIQYLTEVSTPLTFL